ncbi:hypothetical protein DFQ29_008979, partial [Apophysomyces sp. BC1021]
TNFVDGNQSKESEDEEPQADHEHVIERLLRNGAVVPGIVEALDEHEDYAEIEAESLATSKPQSKEPSRRRLNCLKAITKKLLLSSDDSEEVRVFCLISNVLRPFVPRGNARNIPALCLPFIVLADALLGVTGYPEFARNICPMVNPAHVHALNADAVAIRNTRISKFSV